MKSQKIKLFKFIIILFVGMAVLIFLASTIYIFIVVNDDNFVKYDSLKLKNYEQDNFIIFDIDKKNIITNTDNNLLEIENVPQNTINAFLAIEDKRFYHHCGIDFKRVISAFLQNIKYGHIKEGASTITQQLAKNVFLSNEKKIERKINEVYLALKIEKEFTKNEILEMYLNRVYFGRGAFGIAAASKIFFGKEVKELSVAQSAGLAGLLKAPSNYSPIYHYEKFCQRKNLVLKLMYQNGMLDEDIYNSALNEKIEIISTHNDLPKFDYYDAVMRQACQLLNTEEKELLSTKCVIETYCDVNVQKNLELSISKDKTSTINNKNCEKCGIVIDNKTRGVKGFYGNSYDDLLNKKINCGSALKPLAVYCPALDIGAIAPATPVLDNKMTFGANFSPSNYKNKYYGWTSIRNSAINSLNIPAIKVANSIGLKKCKFYLEKNGFYGLSDNDLNLTLAMGNLPNGCTLLQLVNGYSTLANYGNYAKCSFIKKIILKDKVVFKHDLLEENVFSAQTSFLMTDMLKDVIKVGTGKKLKDFNFEIAGKTGTFGVKGGKNFDAVFCGYTKTDSFGFWLGSIDRDDGLPDTVTGGNQPAEMAKIFLSNYVNNFNKPQNFKPPNGIVKIKLNKKLLDEEQKIYLADKTSKNNEIIEDFFNIDYAPKEVYLIEKFKTLDFKIDILENKLLLKSNFNKTKFYLLLNGSEKYLGCGNTILIKPKGKDKIFTIEARKYVEGKLLKSQKSIYLPHD